MSRGNRRQEIFPHDVDRQDFLRTLAEACQKTGWQVHAYCLMSNHYHLAVETPNANLVAGMAWLQKTWLPRHTLASHRKRAPDKLGVAVRLRKETTLSVKQIAARLHLGTPGGASVCLLAAMTKRTSSTQPPSTQGHLET